jgi:hypothetical protein
MATFDKMFANLATNIAEKLGKKPEVVDAGGRSTINAAAKSGGALPPIESIAKQSQIPANGGDSSNIERSKDIFTKDELVKPDAQSFSSETINSDFPYKALVPSAHKHEDDTQNVKQEKISVSQEPTTEEQKPAPPDVGPLLKEKLSPIQTIKKPEETVPMQQVPAVYPYGMPQGYPYGYPQQYPMYQNPYAQQIPGQPMQQMPPQYQQGYMPYPQYPGMPQPYMNYPQYPQQIPQSGPQSMQQMPQQYQPMPAQPGPVTPTTPPMTSQQILQSLPQTQPPNGQINSVPAQPMPPMPQVPTQQVMQPPITPSMQATAVVNQEPLVLPVKEHTPEVTLPINPVNNAQSQNTVMPIIQNMSVQPPVAQPTVTPPTVNTSSDLLSELSASPLEAAGIAPVGEQQDTQIEVKAPPVMPITETAIPAENVPPLLQTHIPVVEPMIAPAQQNVQIDQAATPVATQAQTNGLPPLEALVGQTPKPAVDFAAEFAQSPITSPIQDVPKEQTPTPQPTQGLPQMPPPQVAATINASGETTPNFNPLDTLLP